MLNVAGASIPSTGSGVPSSGRAGVTLLANLALAGLALYVFLDVIAQILPPHYSPIRQAESDLALGPYGFVMTINFVVRGLLSLALLLALSRTLVPSHRSRIGLILLGVRSMGAFLLAAFPTDLRGEHTAHGKIHLLVAFIAFVCVAIAEIILSRDFAASSWASHLARPAMALAIGAVIALLLLFGTPARLFGLFERLFLGFALLWMAIVAIYLSRVGGISPSGDSQRTASPLPGP